MLLELARLPGRALALGFDLDRSLCPPGPWQTGLIDSWAG
jgi:hypothetical protein